jgi:hypothetical protein
MWVEMRRIQADREYLCEVGLEVLQVGLQDVRLGLVVHELAVFLRPDQAGGLKLFHVMGESGQAWKNRGWSSPAC